MAHHMRVIFGYQHQRAICKECNHAIDVGERSARYYQPISKGRTVPMIYHFNCWIGKVYRWFAENPFEPKSRGEAKTRFTKEQLAKRNSIGTRYHRFMALRRKYVADGDFDRLEDIDLKVVKLKLEMEEYGGLPKRWR